MAQVELRITNPSPVTLQTAGTINVDDAESTLVRDGVNSRATASWVGDLPSGKLFYWFDVVPAGKLTIVALDAHGNRLAESEPLDATEISHGLIYRFKVP